MSYLNHTIRRPAAVRRALIAIVTTFVAATACDQQADKLPTSPVIATRTVPHATIVGGTVTVLPTLGGPTTSATDINDAGQVVGSSSTGQGQADHAFVWTPSGGMHDLGTLGGLSSHAIAINNAGQVVGSSDIEGSRVWHAFLWTPGKGMQDLGTLNETYGTYSYARAIDDEGRVMGVSTSVAGSRAFLWTPGHGMQDLGAIIGASAQVIDRNNGGQIVGTATFNGESHAFLWSPGDGMRDLGSYWGDPTVAMAVNEAGWVVGFANPGPSSRPLLWTPRDGMRNLGTLGGDRQGLATDVNDLGQVIGFSSTATLAQHAFVWTETNGMEDIFPMTGLTWVAAINNRGQVVGNDRVVTLQFQAPNRAPVVNVAGPYAGTEGRSVTFALSATDADGDALSYAWDVGDGTTGSGLTPPASHTYADNGTYVVSLSVSDGKGGTDAKTTTATITNVAPTVPIGGLTGPVSPVRLTDGSASAPVTLAFTDPAGPNDIYATQVQCGNGTTVSRAGITSPYAATCTYGSPGVYTVRATVSDDDGGTSAPAFYRYVVVFDPEGAFTTGSGFYVVPGGGKMKAHFSFTVKFQPGRSLPNGSAKFWIPGGQVNFESQTIDMLVAFGNRAQFWGTGTLNGVAARFRITAVEGAKGSDAFRIEIWNAAGTSILYDTQPGAAQYAPVTTPIEGGNVQVHQG